MPQHRRNLYFLWFGCFVSAMSYTLVVPFMPLFLQEMGVGEGVETWSGLCLSASFMMTAIVSPVWGALADKHGRKIMIIRAGAGMGVCYILQYFVTTPEQLLFLRTINGLFSGFIPSSIALLATNTPEEEVGPNLGILQTAQASGAIMGPLFGGAASQFLGSRMTFLFAGCVLFLATVVVALAVRETHPKKADVKMQILQDFKMAWSLPVLRTVLITQALVQTALTVLQPVLSLQVAKLGEQGQASLLAGLVYSMAGIATVIGGPMWARRGERIGYKRIMVIGLLGAGLFNIPQALVRDLYSFSTFRFIVGLATAGVQLSVNAITAKSVDLEFRGRAFGILQSFSQFGAMLGPLVGGIAGTVLGLEATFMVAAAVMMVSSFGAQRLLPKDSERAVAIPE